MFLGNMPFRLALIAALTLGVAACDPEDSNVPTPDAGADSGTDAGTDAGTDSGTDPETNLDVELSLNDLTEVYPPDTNSSFGAPSDAAPFGEAGTSWRFEKTASSPAAQKFELYLPFTFEAGAEAPPAIFDAIREHLGAFTVAELASIEVHSRRDLATSPDFTLVVFTTPTESENDAGWYKNRLHADFSQAAGLDAPVGQWNAFSTAEGANQLRFWDYRKSNVNLGEQPNNNRFTLAEIQGDAFAPANTELAPRDYAAQTVKFITFMTYSDPREVDLSIDGITIRLKDGREATIDLGGDAVASQIVRTEISLAELVTGAPPSAGSSYGAITTDNAFGGSGTSLRYQRAAGVSGKFELLLPFVIDEANPVAPYWDSFRAILGTFTVADIDSLRFATRRNTATTADLSMVVYTTPTGPLEDNDNSWYKTRLHVELANSASLKAPAETWNAFTTSPGANQLRFWDYRHKNQSSWTLPVGDQYFTLADIQTGPFSPAPTLAPRDYTGQTVKFISLSTYTGTTAQDLSVDGFELRLKDGRTLIVDFVE